MTDITRLITRPQINAGSTVVAVLETLLARARTGEITGFGIALLLSNNEAETIVTPSDERLRQIGAISLLLHSVNSN